MLLLGPWAGLVADRSDKRRLLLIVQTIAMVQSFTLAALAFSGSPPVLAIYLVALVGGVTVAFDNPARRAFVNEMVAEDDVQNAVSLNSALMTSSRVVGPALAGLLVATVGLRLVLPLRRPLLHRGARRAVQDADVGAAPPAGDAEGEAPDPRGAALRARRAASSGCRS